MSPLVMKVVNSAIFSFVWNQKHEKAFCSSITQPSCGGLNLVDVEHKVSAIHVMWDRHLVEAPNHQFFYHFSHALRVAFAGRSLQQILLLPALSQTVISLLPSFFCSVMVAWFCLCLENGTIVIEGSGSALPLASLTVRFAYQQYSHLARQEHCCVEKYRSWGLTVNWSTVWFNLHLWCFLHPVCHTNWLIAHHVLPTADCLV